MKSQRRFNHTNRQRILREMVSISVKQNQSGPPSLLADLNLSSLSVPAHAQLFIEAYHKSTTQRFDWGTVGAPQAPKSTVLDQVDLGGRLLFRVKVVDNSGDVGLILASADQIPAADEDSGQQRDHLIVVIAREIGEIPWEVSIPADGETRPALVLNNRIPDVINKIRHDPIYQSLLLPAIVREIYKAIFSEDDGEATDGSWQKSWLDFGEHLAGQAVPDTSDTFACQEWLDTVLTVFSRQHQLTSRVVTHLTGDMERLPSCDD